MNTLKINSILKGLTTSYAILIPCAILVGFKEPLSLIPMAIMTTILGSLLGFLINKFGKE